jgi:hypothetical protein
MINIKIKDSGMINGQIVKIYIIDIYFFIEV